MEEARVKIEGLEEKVLPGFAMEEAAEDLPSGIAPVPTVEKRGGEPLEGDIMPPGAGVPVSGRSRAGIRYESRIRVLEAFQYPGHLKDAPSWVDLNWVGYGDWDPLRGIPPGPALRVPDVRGGVVLARPGDYVVKQSVKLAHGVPDDVVVEVWSREAFEKTFIPAP